MIGFEIKRMFFDRQAVISKVDAATRRVLSRFGAFVRRSAKSSIRKRKKAAPPGQPPSSHSVAFRLEASDVVDRYVRNDHLGLLIPYEFRGVDHTYEPDFVVRLRSGLNVILEVKGFEDAQTTAKHHAARRWVGAVNNAKEHGEWRFHPCRDPQVLERELASLAASPAEAVTVDAV